MKNQRQVLSLYTLTFTIFLLFVILTLSSCGKEDIQVLPPETQTGANTFGCRLNGQVFVPTCEESYTTTRVAIYTRNSKSLEIYAQNNVLETLDFTISDLSINRTNKIDFASFASRITNNEFDVYNGRSISSIVLTKFDTINHVVSGRFEAILKSNTDSTKIKTITQGRFDMHLIVTYSQIILF
jgi:hypothetical protein